MSGATACHVGADATLHLFGVVQEVPANFSSGQLKVARLSQAFGDPAFLRHLESALGAPPEIVAFDAARSETDLGTARKFETQVQDFVDEYLVSETNPVPFGGRDLELRRLDDWLLDETGPPRMLVTAPSGRGKSALLVHWMKNLQDGRVCGSSHWQLAFLPISIRVGTHRPEVFYELLAHRLAQIRGETLLSEAYREPNGFRRAVRDRVDGIAAATQRVLIVIDGLDEAPQGSFDPAILPSRLPATLRVLFSARWQVGDVSSSGWLKRLEWDRNVKVTTFDLPRLDPAGVRDVFVRLGGPVATFAGDHALVGRLVELTEGEPLLIRYYAEDIWKLANEGSGVTRDDLDGLRPGFNNYFYWWFDRQEKLWREEGAGVDPGEVDRVLCVLAFALGPLESADILALGAQSSQHVLAADRLLAPLRRFVLGNGRKGSGYVLSHPRIGQYLQEERFAGKAHEWQSVFATWSREHLVGLNAGRIAPEQASSYVLQFLPQHFDAIGAPPADYMMMLGDGWRRAWEALEGTHTGFARNVLHVRAIVRKHASDPVRLRDAGVGLGGQIRCALCLVSVATAHNNVPAELLALALRYGLITTTQALASLQLMPHVSWQAEGLAEIAPYLSRLEVTDHAAEIFARLTTEHQERFISQLAGRLDPGMRGWMFALLPLAGDELAVSLILPLCVEHLSTEQAAQANAIALAMRDQGCRWMALRDIALKSPLSPARRREVLEQARAAADLAGETARLTLELQALTEAETLSPADRRSIRSESSKLLRRAPERCQIVLNAARRLTDPDRTMLCAEVFDAVSHGRRATLLGPLARFMPGQRLGELLGVARAAMDTHEALAAIAIVAARAAGMAGDGQSLTAEILKALCGFAPSRERNALFGLMRARLMENGFGPVPKPSSVRASASEDDRLHAARMLAFYSASPAPHDRAAAVAAALTAARDIGMSAVGLSEQNFLLRVMEEIEPPPLRATVLADVASIMAPQDRPPVLAEALIEARALPYAKERAENLIAVAAVFEDDQRSSAVEEAIAAAHRIDDALDRKRALIRVASYLSPGHGGQAIKAASTIDEIHNRTVVLGRMAGHLTDADIIPALNECLAAARRIGDDSNRDYALAVLRRANAAKNAQWSGRRNRQWNSAPLSRERLVEVSAFLDERAEAMQSGDLAEPLSGDEQWLGMLLQFLPRTPKNMRGRIVEVLLSSVGQMDNESSKRAFLVELAPHLSSGTVMHARAVARALPDAHNRLEALAALARHLPETEYPTAIDDILTLAPLVTRSYLLAALSQCATVICAVGGQQAVTEAIDAIDEVTQRWP